MAKLWSNLPVMGPPPGVSPNFVDPKNRTDIYIAVYAIFTSLVLLFVSLRLYAKICIIRSIGWDDFSCVVGTVSHLAYSSMILYVSVIGGGNHMWDIPEAEEPRLIRLSRITAILTEPSIFFVKLSILLLLYRLFSPNRFTKLNILGAMVFCFVFYSGTMLLFCFNQSRDFSIDGNYLFLLGVKNVGSNIYILAIPIWAVSKLQLAPGKKLGVMAIFLTGSLACIMSVVGLVYRVQFGTHPDATWNLFSVNIVNTVEVDVGILCSCMPCFPSIFKQKNVIHTLLAPFRSLGSHLSRSRKVSTNENTLKKIWSPDSDFSDSSQYTHPSRPKEHCIEYGKPYILGKSTVKVAVVAKPAAAVRSGAFMYERRHPIPYE